MKFSKIIKSFSYKEFSENIFKEFDDQIRRKSNSIVSFVASSALDGFFDLVKFNNKKGLIFLDHLKFAFNSEFLNIGKSNTNSMYHRLKNKFFIPNDVDDKRIIYPEVFFKKTSPYESNFFKPINFMILELGKNGELDYLSEIKDPKELSGENKTNDYVKGQLAIYNNGNSDKIFNISGNLIFQADRILLIAKGVDKIDAVYRTIMQNSYNPDFPASILSFHKNVSIVFDSEISHIIKI
ncbi:sugar phosphate isomerase family [Mycoplasmopsis primatum]|uniref:hypothetical protein n=1 Tax=Mycoplasmopsis primatum TaxID=55604 RepID=UPI000497B830|nr:hypothetical protein [Mycoplasmopsis primatum]